MDYLKNLIQKLIPANIAGILGVIGTLIPLVRELVMIGLRIADVIMTVFAKPDVIDPIIVKVGNIFDTIQGGWDKIKDFFLQKVV